MDRRAQVPTEATKLQTVKLVSGTAFHGILRPCIDSMLSITNFGNYILMLGYCLFYCLFLGLTVGELIDSIDGIDRDLMR